MSDANFGPEVDDVFAESDKKKKKVNGKKKGNRVELQLCKKLSDALGDTFSRSVGSGNRWGQVSFMPEHAKQTLTGDICVPEHFKWVIECKGGYDDDVDFSGVFAHGSMRIDEFIKQSLHDAVTSDRLPIIMWKRSRQPWIAMMREEDYVKNDKIEIIMHYKNWIIVSLDILLENANKKFWFKK